MWNRGKPPTFGWYLVCARTKDETVQYFVLMAWYNPDAYPNWWKGVEAGRVEKLDLPVHYWQDIPLPPKEEP